MMRKSSWYRLIGIGTFAVVVLLVLIILYGEPGEWGEFFVDRQFRPWLFIVLMLLLPMAGFPITAFLLVIGIKFGPVEGLAITGVIIGIHLIATYLLTRSLLRPYIWKMLAHTRYDLPEIRARRQLPFTMIFMAIPVLPYTVKNFSLALLNVPLRIYLPVGWVANLLLAIPFIGIGHSVITDPRLIWLFLALLGGGYLLGMQLWQRYRRANNPDSEKT